jgi:hypothetical protein
MWLSYKFEWHFTLYDTTDLLFSDIATSHIHKIKLQHRLEMWVKKTRKGFSEKHPPPV